MIVQTAAISTATTGGQTETWSDLLTTWGKLTQKSGSRVQSGYDVTNEVGYDLRVNYQSAIEAVLSAKTMRFKIDSRIYSIQSIEKIGQRNFEYKFLVTEHIG